MDSAVHWQGTESGGSPPEHPTCPVSPHRAALAGLPRAALAGLPRAALAGLLPGRLRVELAGRLRVELVGLLPGRLRVALVGLLPGRLRVALVGLPRAALVDRLPVRLPGLPRAALAGAGRLRLMCTTTPCTEKEWARSTTRSGALTKKPPIMGNLISSCAQWGNRARTVNNFRT